ncbi:hypothetical protein QJS10_CPB15g01087 [Acorus calamus]|uniref:Uncharacterized protein n=1 Tax=Acorus calamus TaxID=4465 RepID=A0AAV9D7R9_ACOCL|nr:hypothetical protein QJS10_CPB15g01087 [Acorus calamus]
MKGRSLKLKEAHKTDGVGSSCSILWDNEARRIITSSSSDPALSIHYVDQEQQPPKPPRILKHHRDGVTAIALSPNSTCLASGSVDHSVKLYGFPGGEFQSNVTRFTLPIRCLAFNRSGSLLAAAGDDEGIKLVATVDGSISRVLKGHRGSVTGLTFDPNNEYLASIDEIGTVIIWELSSGKSIHTLEAIAPDCGSDTSILNIVSWSPDGEMLAVPGLKHDVVMYDRDTAEKLFTLKGEHSKPICFSSWSPNGKYIATSGLDKQVLVWDVEQRQDIDRQKFEDRICSLAWKPNGNALAIIDIRGKFGLWEAVVPSSMKSPIDGIPNSQTRNTSGVLLFGEDDDKTTNISGSLDDNKEDSFGESLPMNRKRLRKQSVLDESMDEESDEKGELLPQVKLRKKITAKYGESVGGEEVSSRFMKHGMMKMQAAFQPGSTPVQAGKRSFLCYNMLGSVTTIENDGYSHIEVDFHDTGRGPRVPSMTDYFGFTMASLNEVGSVFANPCKGEKNMSTLMYRPYSSWANNSEWSMRFEVEEVKVVALGVGWIAAVTSLNFLRIFTEGGLQRHIISLHGPVVTAAGFKDQLAIISHASDCLPSGDQILDVKVFNISNGTQPIKCRATLTPGSSLAWLGFSEEGRLSTYDSKGVLRVFSEQYGGSWLPLFSANREKSEEENYWVVGLSASKLFCITCKSPDTYPQVMPKPVLTLLNLSFPLASSDLGADELENEFMMCNLYLSQIRKKIEEIEAGGLDTSTLDDEAFNVEAALDRCILRLIASCCNGDKLVRATELARLLTLEKSIKGAVKLVTALKLPNLAERISGILEERLMVETMETTTCPNPAFLDAIATNGVQALRPSTLPENKRISEPSIPHPPPELRTSNQVSAKLHSTLSSKQLKTEEKTKMGERKTMPIRNTCEKNVEERINQVGQSHRPTNPFAKASSTGEEKSSLLDSMKKMKKV